MIKILDEEYSSFDEFFDADRDTSEALDEALALATKDDKFKGTVKVTIEFFDNDETFDIIQQM